MLRTDTLRLTTKELHKHTVFSPDTYVLVHYRTGSPPTRLHTLWRGPMKVIEGRDSRYKLLDLIILKEEEYHVSDMKPLLFDAAMLHDVITWNTLSIRFYDTEAISRREQKSNF